MRRMRFCTRSHRYAARRLCRTAGRPGIDCDGEIPARFEQLCEAENVKPRLLGLFAGNWRAYLAARKLAKQRVEWEEYYEARAARDGDREPVRYWR